MWFFGEFGWCMIGLLVDLVMENDYGGMIYGGVLMIFVDIVFGCGVVDVVGVEMFFVIV